MFVIRLCACAMLCMAAPALLHAQDTTARRDSTNRDSTNRVSTGRDSTRRDSTLRQAPRLNQVTITATPVERSEPLTVVHIDTAAIRMTPANSPWELFRDVGGLEAHEQGQGPGFASDLSIRGFSSDHSTDIAVYIDGVPTTRR